MNHYWRRLSVVIICALLISCAALQEKPKLHSFTLIGTADIQGILDPMTPRSDSSDRDTQRKQQPVGGISRLATMIKIIKAEKGNHVMVVSTGDDLMNRYFHAFKGKAIFQLMSIAGYDIYAFGNHEFDKGTTVLSDAVKTANFQFLCTDLDVRNSPLNGLCESLIIKDIDGLKLGFFSLMTEDFPLVTHVRDVTLLHHNIETARESVKKLKDQGAEMVIALTHIGDKKDRELAKFVPGIDIIFGGHSHEYFEQAEKIGNTIIVNGGEKGAYLVRLDVTVNSPGRVDTPAIRYQLIPITEDILPDPDTDKLLADYQKQFPKAVILGRTDSEWKMTKSAIREGESVVANLINDLMREKFQADIALNNAGAFRGKTYAPGPITDVMLKEIDEFGNYSFSLDIKGKYIREILEHSAACFGEGGLLHPSGLRYVIDLRKPAQKIGKNESGKWVIQTPGERVTDIRVLDEDGKWVELEPEKLYRVITNAFIVSNEGDGYFWFKSYGEHLNNTYSTFYSILAEEVEKRGVVNPALPDQRLTIIQ